MEYHNRDKLINWGLKDKILSQAHLIIIIACLIFYGNTISHDYSFDDDAFITENALVQKGIRGIPEILTAFYTWEQEGVHPDYRPVSKITFAIEKEFLGNNPHFGHAVNVLLYGLLALLIFSFLKKIFQLDTIHPLLPLVITLFYVVHPSHTEVVASIKNREEIFSMLFAMLAFASCRKFYLSEQWIYALATIFLLALSFLSKLTALPIIGIILLYWYYSGFKWKGQFIIFLTLLFLLIGCYLVLVASITKGVYAEWVNLGLNAITDVSIRIGAVMQTLLFYFKFMFYPYPFKFLYYRDSVQFQSIWQPLPLLSLFLHLTLIIGGSVWFKRKEIIGFFVLAYLVNISLFSNVIPNPTVFSERVLFMPGLWLIAAVVLVVFKIGGFDKAAIRLRMLQKVLLTAGVVIFIAFGGLTIYRNFQWKDRFTLVSTDMKHLQHSSLANILYGKLLVLEAKKRKGDARKHFFTLAKKHFYRSLELYDSYYNACFDLGMIYEYEEQKRDSAFYFFQRAYNINPDKTYGQFQLAKQHYLKGNKNDAEALFSKLYQALPEDTLTLFFYTQVLHDLNKSSEAFEVNAALLKLAPETYYPYYNYGMMHHMCLDTLPAERNLEKAVHFGYRGEEVFQILTGYYIASEQSDKIKALRKAYGFD